jgi:ABC-type bacteriocin/lantibiotic exporter with double-glycine peptidase domain
MVLRALGHRTRLSELQDEAAGAVSALSIAKLLRGRGVEVQALRLPPEALTSASTPHVANFDQNHFVVIEGFDGQSALVADPAKGRCVVAAAEFRARHSGVVLTFPNGKFRRRDLFDVSSWVGFARRLLAIPGAKGIFGGVVATSVVLQVLSLAAAWVTKLIVDRATGSTVADAAWMTGAGLVALVVGNAVTSALRSLLLIQMQVRLDTALSRTFLRHLLTLPLGFFLVRRAGDLIARMNGNAAIREIVTSKVTALVFDVFFAVGLFAVLAATSLSYACLVLVLGLSQGLLPFVLHDALFAARQTSLHRQDDVQSYTVEILRGIHTVKASGAESRTLAHWMGRYDRLQEAIRREGKTSAISDCLTTTLTVAAPLSLLWLGAAMVSQGQTTVGGMMAMNMLAASVLAPLGTLAVNYRTLQMAGTHIERVAEVLDARPEQEADMPPFPRVIGRIELERVSFRYGADAPEVVREATVRIEPGSRVAIVGRSGSGKSTLAMLLLGLYRPTSGDVRVDGRSIFASNLPDLRSQLGVVLQDPFLFSGTIRDNIRFYRPDLSDAAVRRAAEIAEILTDVEHLPMGFETMVREGGVSLSGGQRQRIALARAIAAEPAVLLLDEATSHLDAVTEHRVAQNLRALRCTQIIIAHRLSTVQNADTILVMSEGKIVECGSHRELIARQGDYADLVAHQRNEGEAAIRA